MQPENLLTKQENQVKRYLRAVGIQVLLNNLAARNKKNNVHTVKWFGQEKERVLPTQLSLPLTKSERDSAPVPPAGLGELLPKVRAAMNVAAGAPEGEGRKSLPDSMNAIAAYNGVKLTQGNTSGVGKDTLDKWLSPSDKTHPPSLMAIVVFCLATRNAGPLVRVALSLGGTLGCALVREVAKEFGLHIMDDQDRRDAAYGRACRLEREAKRAKKRLEERM